MLPSSLAPRRLHCVRPEWPVRQEQLPGPQPNPSPSIPGVFIKELHTHQSVPCDASAPDSPTCKPVRHVTEILQKLEQPFKHFAAPFPGFRTRNLGKKTTRLRHLCIRASSAKTQRKHRIVSQTEHKHKQHKTSLF